MFDVRIRNDPIFRIKLSNPNDINNLKGKGEIEILLNICIK
jgi:hypothetical protein